MHGPHEFDNIIPPTDSNISCLPSISIVALTCSLSGDTKNGHANSNPACFACKTNDAHRVISSYDEFVHEPINDALIDIAQSFFIVDDSISSPNLYHICDKFGK
eukprot:301569_1